MLYSGHSFWNNSLPWKKNWKETSGLHPQNSGAGKKGKKTWRGRKKKGRGKTSSAKGFWKETGRIL